MDTFFRIFVILLLDIRLCCSASNITHNGILSRTDSEVSHSHLFFERLQRQLPPDFGDPDTCTVTVEEVFGLSVRLREATQEILTSLAPALSNPVHFRDDPVNQSPDWSVIFRKIPRALFP